MKGLAIMLSVNRIDNSIEFYGEKIGVLADNHNSWPAFDDISEAWRESCEFEDKLIEAEERGFHAGQKEGWNDAIEKIQYDLDCYLDSILDHSEHGLKEEFKDELYKGISDIIQNAKNLT